MAPKGAKAACSASTDGGAAPSHTTLTDLALNDLIVASRELIVPSALPSAWGQSAHWSWLGDDYASTLLYRKYNYNDYTSLYIAYTCREFTLGYFRNGLPRGWAAEAWAARRWRAPFRSTSLRAEEPAANDAAGPKNGQAGKVVPGGHWAASDADFRDQPPRAHAVVAGRVPAKSRDPRRDFCPKPRPGEKRGPHIDRHLTSRCCRTRLRSSSATW